MLLEWRHNFKGLSYNIRKSTDNAEKLTTDANERLSELELVPIPSALVIASFPDISSKSTTPKA